MTQIQVEQEYYMDPPVGMYQSWLFYISLATRQNQSHHA